ncbi:MAG: efflux RND transporter periplasmic adaptor subunit [Bacteroidetes bacterium]|nr:efflux RND transporter periplasmic adaptor subunit [Bacteroidota bacterium]
MSRKTIYWISGIVAVILLAVGIPYFMGNGVSLPVIETDSVTKSDLTSEITATGTLSAVGTVEVGTQVSGVVAKLNGDFNMQVKKGQILAQLDTRNLNASVTESEAALERNQIQMDISARNYERTKILHTQGISTDLELEMAQAEYLTAKANVSSSSAMLNRNKVNLELATITAPMDGTILSRNVELGQTVAASFNTPTLFTMAADLKVMKIEADVDEADIGQVRKNQQVKFTVDAYPGRNFEGTVTEIRLEPTISQNVVTYTVIVSVNNDDEKLMPGMTATLSIQTWIVKQVVSVTTSAINLAITDDQIQRLEKSGIKVTKTENPKSWIWIVSPGQLDQKAITAGFSNGSRTEINDPALPVQQLVVSVISEPEAGATAAARSPFLPTPPGVKKN